MEIPSIRKEYLTVDEVAERWTDKTGKNITTDRVIAHGEDGSLKFSLIHDMSWADFEGEWYRLTMIHDPHDNVQEAKKPFSPFTITPEQLLRVLREPQPFDVGYLLDGDKDFKNSKLFESRYIPISKLNIRVSLEEVKRFERCASGAAETQALPDYINPNNPHYAEELDIAIQAHTAIFKDKYGNPHQSNSERIISWLSKHFPEQSKSEAFLKRIRTIVLPKK